MLKLHAFQESVVRKALSELRSLDRSKVLIKCPTGSGKTLMATRILIDRYLKEHRNILWMANRWQHIEQFVATLLREASGMPLNIQILGAEAKVRELTKKLNLKQNPRNTNATVIYVSTYSSAGNINSDRLRPIIDSVTAVFMDEDHWGIDGCNRIRIDFYTQNKTIISLTATPKKRVDFKLIGTELTYLGLARDGFLAQCVKHSVPTGRVYVDLLDPKISAIEKHNLRINQLCSDKTRTRMIADFYLRRRNEWGKTLIFCPRTEQAEEIASYIGKDCLTLVADTASSLITSFANTKQNMVATSVNLLVDGVDIPDLNTIFITYSTTSDIRYSQMFGRATRNINGLKPYFNLVDFFDTFQNKSIAKMLDPEAPIFYEGTAGGEDYPQIRVDELRPLEIVSQTLETKKEPSNNDWFDIIKPAILESIEQNLTSYHHNTLSAIIHQYAFYPSYYPNNELKYDHPALLIYENIAQYLFGKRDWKDYVLYPSVVIYLDPSARPQIHFLSKLYASILYNTIKARQDDWSKLVNFGFFEKKKNLLRIVKEVLDEPQLKSDLCKILATKKAA
jgi:superfamily II DNA or RNA helicase